MKKLLLLIVIVLSMQCQNRQTVKSSTFSLNYHYTAETVYEDIKIKSSKITYTFFEDKQNKCAMWLQNTPCWTPQDLTTKEVQLTAGEFEQLINEFLETGILDVTIPVDSSQQFNRAYPYNLKITYGNIVKDLTYMSRPDAKPMPAPFSKCIDIAKTWTNKKIK